jgi:hypothetical protein
MRTSAHGVAASAIMPARIAPNVRQWPGSKCGERQGNFQHRDVSQHNTPRGGCLTPCWKRHRAGESAAAQGWKQVPHALDGQVRPHEEEQH